jgi:hypothetical protein
MESLTQPQRPVAVRGAGAPRRGRPAVANTFATLACAPLPCGRQAPHAPPTCAAWRERAVSAAACSPSGAGAPARAGPARLARLHPSRRLSPPAALSAAASAALLPLPTEPASELYSPLEMESLHNDGIADKDETVRKHAAFAAARRTRAAPPRFCATRLNAAFCGALAGCKRASRRRGARCDLASACRALSD